MCCSNSSLLSKGSHLIRYWVCANSAAKLNQVSCCQEGAQTPSGIHSVPSKAHLKGCLVRESGHFDLGCADCNNAGQGAAFVNQVCNLDFMSLMSPGILLSFLK